MSYFIGLDISDTSTNVCVLDIRGTIVKRFQTSTHPNALASAFRQLNMPISRIGLETGPKSNWIVRELRKDNWTVVLQDSYRMGKLLETRVNKTDDNDAHIIAEATLAGDLIPNFLKMGVHLKSQESETVRKLIRTRQSIVRHNVDIYNEIRGALKYEGIDIPPTKSKNFSSVIKLSITNLAFEDQLGILSMLEPYDLNRKNLSLLNSHLDLIADKDETITLIKTLSGVGNITALYMNALIDDPSRFAKSRSVGAYVGLCPTQRSSGKSHQQGRISKRGDEIARSLLVGAATRILKTSAPTCVLKTKGQEIMKRRGKGRATVAIARKLSVIIHKIKVTKKPYTEEMQGPPKIKKDPIKFTSEEIECLLKLAEKKGHIEFKSIQDLKKLMLKAGAPNQSDPANKNKKSKSFVTQYRRK